MTCCAAGHSTIDLQVILLFTCTAAGHSTVDLQVNLPSAERGHAETCRDWTAVDMASTDQAHHRLQSTPLICGSGTLQRGHTVWTLWCGHTVWTLWCGHTVWTLQCEPYNVDPTVTLTVWTLQCGHTVWTLQYGPNSMDPTVWTYNVDPVVWTLRCRP